MKKKIDRQFLELTKLNDKIMKVADKINKTFFENGFNCMRKV